LEVTGRSFRITQLGKGAEMSTLDLMFDFLIGFAVLATPLAIGTMIVELIESAKRRRAK